MPKRGFGGVSPNGYIGLNHTQNCRFSVSIQICKKVVPLDTDFRTVEEGVRLLSRDLKYNLKRPHLVSPPETLGDLSSLRLSTCKMSAYLSEDLIVEIFTRLPPKSLLRFRSVSKSLCSIISSPAFIRMHTCRSRKKLFLRHVTSSKRIVCHDNFYTLHPEDQLPFSSRGYDGITAVEFPFLHYATVVGSCNGILCVFELPNISLWNPSIRRKITLPVFRGGCSFGLCTSGLGIGFDPTIDDYKIVWIPCGRLGEQGRSTFVYSVKPGVWSAVASSTPLISKFISYGCFFDGALHWVVKRCSTTQSDNGDDDELHYILTFDLSTHLFGTIALPKPCGETGQLTTIKGSLALISAHDDTVWVWVRRDASWSVGFKLEIDPSLRKHYLLTKAVSTSNSDLVLLTPWVFAHNLKTLSVSRVAEFFDKFSDIFDPELLSETLELLDMGTPYEVKKLSSFLGGKRKRSVRLNIL